ncbi:lipopolysaccharide assembly protein LapA domain-containing protein [Neomegalonema sp.]|uniref:lipopolysaccharide assembly protein LapA domain-containing protein n=1 Tax=Neomegalonema sp. TaxID=2039713 RepID=UPI002623BA2B|nr:lipopolysaccharide assembly protein LapA domain-containing protein [Neomegalonema sp.]MDD2868241.1 lipopolysaccharide assembly protein LapA domain-containing protein [Neomegalonema sp.]
MTYLKLILLALLATPLAALIMMNPHPVTVRLDPLGLGIVSPAQVELPLAALVIGAALLGLLIGVVLEWIREAGERREKARAERRIAELEARLATLQPLHAGASPQGGAVAALR